MNQVLFNKKVLIVCNDRIARPNLKNRFCNCTGLSNEHIFTNNYNMFFLESENQYDLILWDVVHPLMGLFYIDEIQKLSNLPLAYQVLGIPKERHNEWFYQGFWQALTEKEINFLYSSWLKKVSFFLECVPNIIMLPVTTAYFDAQLPFRNCIELLQTLNCKIIDFQISAFSQYPFEGERGILKDVAWKELIPKILEVING